MFRRSFLKSLAAAPVAGSGPSAAAGRGAAQGQDHQGQHLRAAQREPAVQPEQHAGDGGDRHRHHGHRRGRSRDTLEQCAGNLIGQNPFQIERLWHEMYDLLVLSAGPGEDPRPRRHGPGAVGHQGQSAEYARSTRSWAARCATTASATPPATCARRRRWRRPRRAGWRRRCAAGSRQAIPRPASARAPRPPWRHGYRVYRMDAGGITPVVENVYNSRERVRLVGRGLQSGPRRPGQDRRLHDRLPPAVRLHRRAALLQG